jgi:hypothetical protein
MNVRASTTRAVAAALVVMTLGGMAAVVAARAHAADPPTRLPPLQRLSPVASRYNETEPVNIRAFLGAAVDGEHATPTRPGSYQFFERGAIYYSAATGAHVIYGAILEKWGQLGYENGVLGFPTTDETGAPDGRGRFNHFEFGSIYWTPQTGAHEVHGAIRDTWAANGWETAGGSPPWAVGYPVTDETVAPDGRGRFNFFENGAIYWSLDSGAHRVYGRILDKWGRDGYEARMGYPIDEPHLSGSGNFCLTNLHQTFVRPDGTGGTYCEQPGYVLYRPRGQSSSGAGLPSVIRMGNSPSSTTTGPMEPAPSMAMPASGGTWVCISSNLSSIPSVPAGLVATQYDKAACNNQGSIFVMKPQSDLWICAWANGAIDGYTVDRVEPASGVCAFGNRYHIVKL